MLDIKFEWDRDGAPEVAIKPKLADVDRKVMLYTAGLFKREALIAESQMKTSAPWTDRTGNARNGLKAQSSVDVRGGRFVLTMFHSVPYGIWLEIKNQGRYAVVRPQVKRSGDHLMSLFSKMMDKMGVMS